MKRIGRTIATILAGSFALAMAIGCSSANQSSAPDTTRSDLQPGAPTSHFGGNRSGAPNDTQTAKGADSGDPQNAIQVTAMELGKELKGDAAAAEKKYAGKTLIVSGTVGLILHDIATLETGEKGVEVKVFLNSKSTLATTKVESGYAVKVRGKASFGLAGILDLVDCTILESKLAETPPIPAARLTEEYTQDKDAIDSKYFLKKIVVEGVVAKVVFEPKNNERYILLAGHNETDTKPLRVQASFKHREDQDEALKKITKGQTVKVRGQYRLGGFGDIVVGDCEILP